MTIPTTICRWHTHFKYYKCRFNYCAALRWLAAAVMVQASSLLFNQSFITGSAVPLLLPLMRILSLGYSAAAVTNYVQSVSAVCLTACSGTAPFPWRAVLGHQWL